MTNDLRATYLRALQTIADAGGIEGDALRPIACPFDPAMPADRLGLAMIAAALHERQRRGYAVEWDAVNRDVLTMIAFPNGASSLPMFEASAALSMLSLIRSSHEREALLHAYVMRVVRAINDRSAMQPIAYVLTELTANIWDHAETERGFVVAGIDRHALVIAVVDAGLSIPLSYDRRGIKFPDSPSHDLAAIDAALEGRSARPQGERGYGLRTSAALVMDGWSGSFLLASRRALRYRAPGGSPLGEVGLSPWAGTVVAVTLPLPLRPVDLYAYVER
ncbi:hypothetical protein HY635_02400 [Candidatus Uhrbacteria bacterium]|nr:hypothetical protein [Candidatus Uhrbacteria bacterium]